jgi:hypothetical protein
MSAVIPVSIARVMMGKMIEQTLPAQHHNEVPASST